MMTEVPLLLVGGHQGHLFKMASKPVAKINVVNPFQRRLVRSPLGGLGADLVRR
jgi:hypothetical protein